MNYCIMRCMRKIVFLRVALFLILIFILVVICSCDTTLLTSANLPEELKNCDNEKEVRVWMYNNITYQRDIKQYGGSDYWAAPERTLQSRRGDCDDIAILYGYLLKVLFNKNIKIIMAYSYYGEPGHSFNKVGNKYVEPQTIDGRVDKTYLSGSYRTIEYYFDYIYLLVKNNRK